MYIISSMMPQMYENVTNNLLSSETPFLNLFTSYYSLTYSSLCSCEPPSANCLFVVAIFFSSSYGTFNYYFSSQSVFVFFFLFFFLFSFCYCPSSSLATQAILSISHFQIRVCVCVCVCVCMRVVRVAVPCC